MKVHLRLAAVALLLGWFSTSTFSQDSLQTSVEDSRIALEATVQQTTVPLNRDVEFTVKLTWSGNLDRFEVHPFDNPLLENLQIQGSGSANRVTNVDGVSTAIREYTFMLKPESLGMAYIEPMIVLYTDLATDTEHRLTTNRIPVKIVEPVNAPGSHSAFWWILLPVLGALVVFLLLRRQQMRKARQAAGADEPEVPIEQLYLQELHDEIDLNDSTQDAAKAYSKLSRLLRRFLHEKYNAPGFEATSAELYQFLYDNKFSDEFINNVKELLNTADVIKFSGRAVEPSEVQNAHNRVESIFQQSLSGEIQNDVQVDSTSA